MTNSIELDISQANDPQVLARLDLPADGAAIATAIFAHAFPADIAKSVDRILSRELNRFGIAVLLLNYADRLNGSVYPTESLTTEISRDLRSAVQALVSQGLTVDFLMGHSGPCGPILQIGRELPSVKALAVIGAAVAGESDVYSGEASSRLMIIHAMRDERVNFSEASRLYDAAEHPKSFIPLEEADHFLTNPADSAHVGAMLAQWLRSHVGVYQEDVKHLEKHDNCTVAITRKDSYRTEVLSNGHSLVSDEPKELNGENTGPTPYGFLLAALGACTTITLRMYAERKDFPLESVHVRLTHERIHAEDCECDAADRTGLLDVIRKYVILEGDLSDGQRKRLMQIADLCPIQKTLKNQPVIDTTFLTDSTVLECS